MLCEVCCVGVMVGCLGKNYNNTFSSFSVLVSMAPLSQEVRSLSSCQPPHLGPPVPEMNSIWFKLWLYQRLGDGPPSVLLAKGTRLRKLPPFLKVCVNT